MILTAKLNMTMNNSDEIESTLSQDKRVSSVQIIELYNQPALLINIRLKTYYLWRNAVYTSTIQNIKSDFVGFLSPSIPEGMELYVNIVL